MKEIKKVILLIALLRRLLSYITLKEVTCWSWDPGGWEGADMPKARKELQKKSMCKSSQGSPALKSLPLITGVTF